MLQALIIASVLVNILVGITTLYTRADARRLREDKEAIESRLTLEKKKYEDELKSLKLRATQSQEKLVETQEKLVNFQLKSQQSMDDYIQVKNALAKAELAALNLKGDEQLVLKLTDENKQLKKDIHRLESLVTYRAKELSFLESDYGVLTRRYDVLLDEKNRLELQLKKMNQDKVITPPSTPQNKAVDGKTNKPKFDRDRPPLRNPNGLLS
ncbi:hypothetical protein DXI20_13885 [Vibrio alginolyticus]|nr:hypothetical protein [Vibrio alginolyticus]